MAVAVALGTTPVYAAYAGVAQQVLDRAYPENAPGTASAVVQATQGPVWAGINFPSDGRAGLDLGRKVGAVALRRLP